MKYKGFILEQKQGVVFASMPEPIFESTNFGWYNTIADAKSFIDNWLKVAGIDKLKFKNIQRL